MNPQEQGTIVGYCRACGKALDALTVQHSGGTIYCAEHVPASNAPNSTYQEPESPYTRKSPPPIPETGPSPGTAFILGLIPGVGAIYNGQYGKGLVHIFILGLLWTVVDSGQAGGFEPVFAILIPGFWAYMAFEAYHTARNKQLGKPVDEFSSLVPGRGGSRFPVAPMLLIGFGTVILLSNLEIIEFRRALRYWPVLMIGLGVYMLYLRVAGKPEGADHDRQ